MKTRQTAVDWLFEQIFKDIDTEFVDKLKVKAKAMEKEQIIDAYEYGYWRGNNEDECEPDEYYENPYCNPNNKYYGK